MSIFDIALNKLKNDGYNMSHKRDFRLMLENPKLAQTVTIGDIAEIRTYRVRFRPTKADIIINALSDEISSNELLEEMVRYNDVPTVKVGKSIFFGFDIRRVYSKTMLYTGNLDLILFKPTFIEAIREFNIASSMLFKRCIDPQLSTIMMFKYGNDIASDVIYHERLPFDMCYPLKQRIADYGKRQPVSIRPHNHEIIDFRKRMDDTSSIIKVDDANTYIARSKRNKNFHHVTCYVDIKSCFPIQVSKTHALNK